MDPDRKYTDDEVAEIFDRATESVAKGRSTGGSPGGLTLREIQEIGREVGISQDAITKAADSLDRPAVEPGAQRKFLGQTIGVGRTVYLPRALTDQEWHRLIVDLRDTFDARGRIRGEGAFRQWSNGNLHALLEPTESGERLRLRTLKGSARPYQTLGAVFTGLAAVGWLAGGSDPGQTLMFIAMGIGFFLASRLTVPAWARRRERQFDDLIARLTGSLGTSALPPDVPGPDEP